MVIMGKVLKGYSPSLGRYSGRIEAHEQNQQKNRRKKCFLFHNEFISCQVSIERP